ncbi:PE domain-containing protein [Pseudonocardia sp.]|uniref:PE domain-containing protein n=1 Tax=Pseudonocardia sp. TaxID=60912 RepID=UPI003D09E14E
MDVDIDGLRAGINASAAGMSVNRENVLKVGAVLLAEADRLDLALSPVLGVEAGLCGGDPVSQDAAAAFTERAQLLMKAYQGYIEDLRRQADALQESARSYGYAEAEIRAVFGDRR